MVSNSYHASKSDSIGIRQRAFRGKQFGLDDITNPEEVVTGSPKEIVEYLQSTSRQLEQQIALSNHFQDYASTLYTPYFIPDAPDHGLQTRVYISKRDIADFKKGNN
jgi:hypothetical protein